MLDIHGFGWADGAYTSCPLVAEPQEMYTLPGKPDSYRQNMVGYPCGFSIRRAPGQPTDYYFSMDNQDIVYILD
jgi:hypothetical protein